MTPYRFKFRDPSRIITAIVCIPKDPKMSSPELEVISGGVGHKEAEIVLTPVHKGGLCCFVQINGVAENRLQTNSIPKQLTM
jgi:hypothetical protein